MRKKKFSSQCTCDEDSSLFNLLIAAIKQDNYENLMKVYGC